MSHDMRQLFVILQHERDYDIQSSFDLSHKSEGYILLCPANDIKHDHRSKNPTTRWTDIIKLV